MVNEAELPDEVVKVLVAGVDVSLSTHVDDAVKVVDVDMDKDTEEPGEDLSANLLELLGEGNTYPGGEDVLVVNEHLDPVHQHTHVLRSRHLGWLLVFAIILPPVLVLESTRHDGAALFRAVLRHGAVDEVDAVEEVHHVHRDPVVDALTGRQLHH